ncbi:response regulator transcription factor [Nocardia sp. CA2R105]|uniref:response regulator transcription factor n=1 Tax=Nocardia coffeae TaxID=2873381 RepID=UPI001CA6C8F4|nr:response regulator transcription factor [Nocardia coffeae]MBY8858227.1 response regulator transcription factor [Nocardia coffeae]
MLDGHDRGVAQDPGASDVTLIRGSGQRLLVVDDDPGMAELLATTLRLAGYDTSVTPSGAEALRLCGQEPPDLLVLDLTLPDVDGLSICRTLGEHGGTVPILVVTARDAVEDKIVGLALGADDYLVKPFSVPEVLARVHALLRRARTVAEPPVEPPATLRYADLALDEHRRQARRGERRIPLTPTEYKLLEYLLTHPERVLSKDQIMDHVWEYRFRDQVVEKLVSRLRGKIDPAGPRDASALIHTVRGFGYRLGGRVR